MIRMMQSSERAMVKDIMQDMVIMAKDIAAVIMATIIEITWKGIPRFLVNR
ncbi:MAG: hypothetical protein ACLSFZ_05545 [Frisingicoccus sp.]